MKTTLKVLGIIATVNLLSNVGLKVIMNSGGSVAGLGYDVTGRLARVTKFAMTPTPVMTIKMMEDSADQRHPNAA